MSKLCRFVAAIAVAIVFVCVTAAQEQSSMPKVLQITREFVKPGKGGTAHQKAESAFVNAMRTAKWPTYYLAVTSLTGKPRVLFLTSYASFEAWEKDGAAVDSNPTLSAALDRAFRADGELLDAVDQGVFVYQEELSLRPKADISHMRFLEASVYHVRPGHDSEWQQLVKIVKAGYEKALPEAHWATLQEFFGGEGGNYLVLTSRKTLGEIDQDIMNDKKFAAAMGEDGMKKLDELFAASVDMHQHNLFAFEPKMSYVDPAWIKADPDFWKPKMAVPVAKSDSADKKTKP